MRDYTEEGKQALEKYLTQQQIDKREHWSRVSGIGVSEQGRRTRRSRGNSFITGIITFCIMAPIIAGVAYIIGEPLEVAFQ